MNSLIDKYNVPVPRYTSYPTVPYWDTSSFDLEEWKKRISSAFQVKGKKEGISVYIHLPFCESLCTYCGCNTRITLNHAVELPYIAAVLQEWNLYLALFDDVPIIKELHLGGGTPTFFSPENLDKLLNGIKANAIISQDAEFSFEAHPNNTTESHLRILYQQGFRRLSLGIQDFDPQVQEIIHRPQSFGQVEYVTDLARLIGYTSINYDLIYGLPLQTLSSVTDTINKIRLLKPDRIAFYSYAHVPWLKPGQRKFTEHDLPTNETKRSLYETGCHLLEEAGYMEVGMDHFALPEDNLNKALANKTLHRNFMGYTTCNTSLLIGLGCSSIGETGTAFAQNVKKVEEYIQKIKEGQFAVFQGHLMTEKDQEIQGYILDIICAQETIWDDSFFLSEEFYFCKERLVDLEKDGLIDLQKNNLHVTDLGKAFIRNICAAFDVRMHQKKTDKQLFSKAI